jgi:hypothetical protein
MKKSIYVIYEKKQGKIHISNLYVETGRRNTFQPSTGSDNTVLLFITPNRQGTGINISRYYQHRRFITINNKSIM